METTRREFVSNVSHELRSPIASVKALVESLEDGAVEERETARDFLQRIHREVDRMSNLVSELLHLARLETGQESLDLRAVDLEPMIHELVKEFQPNALSRGVVLKSDVADDLPQVVGDQEKLRQALVNLMNNALKFTPEQGEITVLARPHDRLAEVCIEDTGIGIAEEHLAHIFERFYKVDRSRRDGGTGLGLCHREAHHRSPRRRSARQEPRGFRKRLRLHHSSGRLNRPKPSSVQSRFNPSKPLRSEGLLFAVP